MATTQHNHRPRQARPRAAGAMIDLRSLEVFHRVVGLGGFGRSSRCAPVPTPKGLELYGYAERMLAPLAFSACFLADPADGPARTVAEPAGAIARQGTAHGGIRRRDDRRSAMGIGAGRPRAVDVEAGGRGDPHG